MKPRHRSNPRIRIEDARDVVAQLQQIAPILDDDDRRDSVAGLQRALIGQEVLREHRRALAQVEFDADYRFA